MTYRSMENQERTGKRHRNGSFSPCFSMPIRGMPRLLYPVRRRQWGASGGSGCLTFWGDDERAACPVRQTLGQTAKFRQTAPEIGVSPGFATHFRPAFPKTVKHPAVTTTIRELFDPFAQGFYSGHNRWVARENEWRHRYEDESANSRIGYGWQPIGAAARRAARPRANGDGRAGGARTRWSKSGRHRRGRTLFGGRGEDVATGIGRRQRDPTRGEDQRLPRRPGPRPPGNHQHGTRRATPDPRDNLRSGGGGGLRTGCGEQGCLLSARQIPDPAANRCCGDRKSTRL